MRKTSVVVLSALIALLGASYAQADDIQSIEAKISPNKLDKKKFKPAKIWVEIITGNNVDGPIPNQPPRATNTKVNFPKNLKFNTGAVPKCKVSHDQLENTSTEQATELCGAKSIVSVGSNVPTGPEPTTGTSAWIGIGGPSPLGEPVVVTAFNGKEKNSLYLHSRAQNFPITSVLIGKLKKGPKAYGSQLDVTVPPLAAGGIARFTVTVKAKSYVQARCKSKTMKYQAITTFEDHPKVSDNYSHKCTQKKAKKKKGKKGKRK
jgi:hypothetical protein